VSKKALRKFVKNTQSAGWDRLLDGTRRSLARPGQMSMEIEREIHYIRQSIALVGPVKWGSIPWAVYVSGLYAAVIGPAHEHALPGMLEHAAAVERMKDHTNAVDVQRCIDLANALRRNHP
jgi:hypothetical protein